ncbi:MAG: GPW/gp25 family protein [bacterium]
MAQDFLGTGWGFPIETNETGHVTLASQDESIRQSIWTILGTSPGERVMRPDFGCGIDGLVFDVNDAGLAGQVGSAVRNALAVWEPRIDVLNVNAFPDKANPNLLLIEISYQVRSNNSRFNLVYPFYLE